MLHCMFPICYACMRRYVLAHIEMYQGMQEGDKIWQLGFGAGFKCNSAVWQAMRPVRDRHRAWIRKDGSDGVGVKDSTGRASKWD